MIVLVGVWSHKTAINGKVIQHVVILMLHMVMMKNMLIPILNSKWLFNMCHVPHQFPLCCQFHRIQLSSESKDMLDLVKLVKKCILGNTIQNILSTRMEDKEQFALFAELSDHSKDPFLRKRICGLSVFLSTIFLLVL